MIYSYAVSCSISMSRFRLVCYTFFRVLLGENQLRLGLLFLSFDKNGDVGQ